MILAVDIGNTNIVIGLMEGTETVDTYRITTRSNHTSDEYGLMILQFLQLSNFSPDDVQDAIISSVVPKVMHSFISSMIKFLGIDPMIIGPGIKTGMNIRMDDPRSLGADLLADCAGAYTTYGGPVLVIDMGTATTYNYVDEKGAILAGLITTGIGTAAAALASNTAQLPEVQITRPRSILAANTKDAMQAGLYYDCLGGIERTITQFREELDTDFKVVATGGMSRIFDCPLIDVIDPTLIFKGMASIYAKNV